MNGYILLILGEGAGCYILTALDKESIHKFMCCCKDWKTCEAADEALATMAVADNWSLDEEGNRFGVKIAEYETGKVFVYKLS